YFPAQCVDAPLRWASLMGSTCADYDSNEWCTLARGYGAGWETAWGSFDHYAVEGAAADQACCVCGGGREEETPRLLWPSATPCVPRRWTPARPWRTRRAVQTPRRARCAAPRSSPHSRRRSPTRRWRSRRPRPRRPASRGSGPPPRRPAAAPPQGLGASGPAWPDCGTAPGEMRASRLPHAGAERCSRPHAESLTPSARR
ncbi:unnamed protein product, partial [Prorocentrum cordatum]